MKRFSNTKLGVWSLIDSFHVLVILLEGDIDFVVIDMEHGYWSREQLAIAVNLCQKVQKYAVVRIPNPNQEWIQLAFDSLADVVQIAGVRSQADINKVYELTNYPPKGTLGTSPWTPQSYFGKKNLKTAPKISLQIENVVFLEEFIRGELTFPDNINSIFIGRYDLSVSMGISGDIDNIEILKLMALARSKATDLGLLFGTVSNSLLDLQKLQDLPLDFISLNSDVQRLLGQTSY
jgi:2-keto-3-deoxy-L-rhamnonate aldolase RhmA